MADNFGLKIGIEGEKAFKQALVEINSSMRVLGSEMKMVESSFDSQDKSVEALTARNAVLDKSIDNQKKKISTLQDALKNATDSFGENDRRTKNWTIQLNNAQAELNKLEREVNQNNESLKKSKDGFDSAKDKVSKFGDEVEKSSKKSKEASISFEGLGTAFKAVAATIAVASAAVSAAAISAGKALVKMTVEGSEYADTVLTESAVTGIATDKLQEYMYAAELVDVSVETLTNSMAKNIKSMKSAADGSKTFVDAYDRLGVSVIDSNGEFRDSDTVYWEIIDSLSMLENETERDALAMSLLGKSAQELNPLITAGASTMRELGLEAKKAGFIVSDQMLNAYGALDDQLQYLNSGAKAAKNALGTILLPLLTNLAGEGVDLLGEFTNGVLNANGDLSKVGEVIGEILPKALNGIMQYFPTILSLIGTVLKSIGKAILDNLPAIVKAAGEIVSSLLSSLIGALPEISSAAGQIIGLLSSALIDNLPLLMDSLVFIVSSLVDKLGESLPTLLPAIAEVLSNIIKKIVDSLPQLIQGIIKVVRGLSDGIKDALHIILSAVLQGTKDILKSIIGSLPQLVGVILSLVKEVVKAVLGAVPDLIRLVGEILPLLNQEILNSIPEIINTISTIILVIVDMLPSIIDSLVKMIPFIIEGIITAVLEATPEIISAIFELVLAIVDSLPTIILTLVNAIPELIGGIIDALIKCIPMLIECGVELFTSLITNFPEIIQRIVQSIPLIIERVVNALESLFYKIVDAGKNIVTGLWEGIKSMADWLWDKVGDFFGGIVDGITNFLGIHSPSTLFAGIGENMGQGIGVGFVDSMRSVENEIKDAIPTDFDIEARTNIRNVATDSIQPNNPSNDYSKSVVSSGSTSGSIGDESREQVNLLREQNRILRQLLDKDISIVIGDEEIGRANTRYEKKRGLVVNEGGFSNAY